MKTWNSKLVNFLANYNSVIIDGKDDYENFIGILKRVGLKFVYNSYKVLIESAIRNNFLIDKSKIIIDYNNAKGFCIGYKSVEESIDWHGEEPYKVNEILDELKG